MKKNVTMYFIMLVMLLSVAGNAAAVTVDDITYMSQKNRTWSILAADLQPMDSTMSYIKTGGILRPTSALASFSAPVHLPDGATIVSFCVRYKTTVGAPAFNVYLQKYGAGHSSTVIGQVSPVYGMADWDLECLSQFTSNTISNLNDAYWIYVDGMDHTNPNQQLSAVLLQYRVDSPLP